ncbi:hypothetical protein V6N13_113898 [Hibiscus sabdariffa]|uniref:Secreted protein n=1 Tax=Hibiscus sabdariffa TaxID=183260 RepID=A0ABR2U0Q2_9ROSI
MMARRWVAVMFGGEAAWTVAVLSLVISSAMQRWPSDGSCSHDQRLRCKPSDGHMVSNADTWHSKAKKSRASSPLTRGCQLAHACNSCGN